MYQTHHINRYAVASLWALAAAGAAPSAGLATTITGWNTDNVVVDTSNTTGVTGVSAVYDKTGTGGTTVPPGATKTGGIAFTPDEAISPGLKVQPESYPDTGQGATLQLDGCIMTSNPNATCTSGFQSGKRVKQLITSFEPVDLVFDIEPSDGMTAYQVFGRLIKESSAPLAGATVELGFGVGDAFVAATPEDQLRFSTTFTAQPNNSGLSSTSQFPFGLFGDADDSPNFLLDGFFAKDRSGFNLIQTETTISTAGFYGAYGDIFGPWNSRESVVEGLFWDFDNNADTDNLLMAWQIGADQWEARRIVGETCDVNDSTNCTPGMTLDEDDYFVGTYGEVLAFLEAGNPQFSIFDPGPIEDLANLNLNYAIELGDLGQRTSFTLQTSVTPVPLPTGMPLLLGGLGMIAILRRRIATNGTRSL